MSFIFKMLSVEFTQSENQSAGLQTGPGEAFGFCVGAWEAAEGKVGSTWPGPPSVASASTPLLSSFRKQWFPQDFVFIKFHCFKNI